MQLLLPRQMAANTATICDLYDQFPKFSMPLPLVREARCANASQVLLGVCQLYHDCTYDTLTLRFPNCVRRLDCVESHDQLKLQVLSSRRNDHHLEQRLLVETMGQNGDKEFEQIL
jgi:hypothetical protein